MRSRKQERRQHKRYSGVPLQLYLKKNDEYTFLELVDVSAGGFLSNTSGSYEIYDEYEAKIKFPNHDVKDVVHAHAMVWRIEANKNQMNEKKRFIAFKFIKISDVDMAVINEFLEHFESNVPYK
jgi:c-di-GMP-binding flagellar brake protein YcgR